MNEDKKLLSKYLPEKAVEVVYNLIVQNNVLLRISRSRMTKLGDYRPARKDLPHRISLNHDLNSYDFLITFIHELAHLYAFEKHGRNHQPHGIEWKDFYRKLMQPLLETDIFPSDIKQAVYNYLFEQNASNGSDTQLKLLLRNYNKEQNTTTKLLETLPEMSRFKLSDGRVFQKLELRRKRYKCVCLNSKRLYLFSPIALVEPVETL